MTGRQLRAIRHRMGLFQAQLGERLRLTGNSIARMERDEVAITPPMELLISYVARDAGVDLTHGQTSRGAVADKTAHGGKFGNSVRKDRRGKRR